MKVVKGKCNGTKIEEIPTASMMLLPPRPGVCQECATDHDPAMPHNQQSLYYQTKFQMEHGRSATWADAMAHCSDDVKATWIAALKTHGVEVSS